MVWLKEEFGPVQPNRYLFPFYDKARRPHDRTAEKRLTVEALALPKAANANGVPGESPKVTQKPRLFALLNNKSK